jgi:hypothetical protein
MLLVSINHRFLHRSIHFGDKGSNLNYDTWKSGLSMKKSEK